MAAAPETVFEAADGSGSGEDPSVLARECLPLAADWASPLATGAPAVAKRTRPGTFSDEEILAGGGSHDKSRTSSTCTEDDEALYGAFRTGGTADPEREPFVERDAKSRVARDGQGRGSTCFNRTSTLECLSQIT